MKVLIAQKLPVVVVNPLVGKYEVEEADHILSKSELIASVLDKDALVCTPFNVIDSEVLNATKNLKVIVTLSVGFEHIDIKTAGELGIIVANIPGTATQSVAELAFAHILALARRVAEADDYVRSGEFKEWNFDLMVGIELRGKILGVIGFGAIGQCLVPMARGFGMQVLYNNRRGEIENFKNDSLARLVDLDEIFKTSDFVVCTVTLTDETKHLVTYEKLSKMRQCAFLINVSRGPVVKESDLVRALKEKKIAGAGLDVYEFEPRISEELLKMRNVVLTPHIGSATRETRSGLVAKAAQLIIDALETGHCENIVNDEYFKHL